MALAAQMLSELLHHLSVDAANGSRIGGDLKAGLFQVLEQDVSVEGEIELCRIHKLEYEHVVAFEAKEAKPPENFLGIVEEVGD